MLFKVTVFGKKNHLFSLTLEGIELESENKLTKKVQLKSYDSIKESDQILFLVDAHDGITNSDKEILKEIRKFDKDILLVINKVDNENLHNTNDFLFTWFR